MVENRLINFTGSLDQPENTTIFIIREHSLNSTCLLRSHSGISINWAPVAHGESVRFMEMSAL